MSYEHVLHGVYAANPNLKMLSTNPHFNTFILTEPSIPAEVKRKEDTSNLLTKPMSITRLYSSKSAAEYSFCSRHLTKVTPDFELASCLRFDLVNCYAGRELNEL